MFQSLISNHVESPIISTPFFSVPAFVSNQCKCILSTHGLSYGCFPFGGDASPVDNSAVVFAVQAQDFNVASICSAKFGLAMDSSLYVPFFWRYEGESFPIFQTLSFLTTFPFSGDCDATVMDSTPSVSGRTVWFGVGFYFPKAVSDALYGIASVSQYSSTSPFFQPLK